MEEKKLEKLISFFEKTVKLKNVDRTGWDMWADIEDPESVADHTFMTTLMTMVISDIRGLDTEKAMKMAILHDIGESIIGDWDSLKTKQKGRRVEKDEKESKAFRKIMEDLPERLEKEYKELFEELLGGETKESLLVKELDNLELFVQASEYEKEGYEKEKLDIFWDDRSLSRKRLKDPELVKLLEILEKSRND